MQRVHARNLYIGTAAEMAALSLPADGIGATYYNTDDGFVYFWTGTSWASFNSDLAFTDLTDVPANYTGASGKLVKVKADESGLEFVAPSAGSGDVTGPEGATTGNIPLFADATGKVIDGGIPTSNFEPAKGADDNYVTDAEKVVIGNTSGTNTGDQQGDGITITGAGTPADPFVAASGSGDVAGPAGAGDENIPVFDGVTGKVLKDSAINLSTLSSLLSGWIPKSGTWEYVSADDPTYVVRVNADVTAVLGVGMRMKFTNNGTTFYGIITAVGAYSGGYTNITLYGGTDYDVANSAITSVYYSTQKSPFGFPMDPTKWTVRLDDTTARSQATPTSDTWYSPGSLSLSIPIGAWRFHARFPVYMTEAADILVQIWGAVSTANNSSSDGELACWQYTRSYSASAAAREVLMVFVQKILVLAAKTTYYPVIKVVGTGIDNIYINNSASLPLNFVAVCAYL